MSIKSSRPAGALGFPGPLPAEQRAVEGYWRGQPEKLKSQQEKGKRERLFWGERAREVFAPLFYSALSFPLLLIVVGGSFFLRGGGELVVGTGGEWVG